MAENQKIEDGRQRFDEKFVVLTSDKLFFDSPDAGQPECICSRCGNMIKEDETVIRVFHLKINAENRYCEKCSGIEVT
jgi:hypothetical protein